MRPHNPLSLRWAGGNLEPPYVHFHDMEFDAYFQDYYHVPMSAPGCSCRMLQRIQYAQLSFIRASWDAHLQASQEDCCGTQSEVIHR